MARTTSGPTPKPNAPQTPPADDCLRICRDFSAPCGQGSRSGSLVRRTIEHMFDTVNECPPRNVLPPGLAEMAPGPELAAVLAGLDRSVFNGHEMVIVLQARSRLVSHDQAEMYADMMEVALSPPGDAALTPGADRAFGRGLLRRDRSRIASHPESRRHRIWGSPVTWWNGSPRWARRSPRDDRPPEGAGDLRPHRTPPRGPSPRSGPGGTGGSTPSDYRSIGRPAAPSHRHVGSRGLQAPLPDSSRGAEGDRGSQPRWHRQPVGVQPPPRNRGRRPGAGQPVGQRSQHLG